MLVVLLLCGAICSLAEGHARMLEPPGRASMWRFPELVKAHPEITQDYTDDEGNCGGIGVQHESNGHKCGICGDRWDEKPPRKHEAGGPYGLGIVVRKYQPGQTINVTIDVTTNHLGWFEFRVCPVDDKKEDATQECLDKNQLRFSNGDLRYPLARNFESKNVTLSVVLPSNLTCHRCVMQFNWICGNNWGLCDNQMFDIGCGDQETFRSCADIAIQ